MLLSSAVADSRGAAVPDTLVTVRNTNTGLIQTTRTSVNGIYHVLYLTVAGSEINMGNVIFGMITSTQSNSP